MRAIQMNDNIIDSQSNRLYRCEKSKTVTVLTEKQKPCPAQRSYLQQFKILQICTFVFFFQTDLMKWFEHFVFFDDWILLTVWSFEFFLVKVEMFNILIRWRPSYFQFNLKITFFLKYNELFINTIRHIDQLW